VTEREIKKEIEIASEIILIHILSSSISSSSSNNIHIPIPIHRHIRLLLIQIQIQIQIPRRTIEATLTDTVRIPSVPVIVIAIVIVVIVIAIVTTIATTIATSLIVIPVAFILIRFIQIEFNRIKIRISPLPTNLFLLVFLLA